MHIYSSCLVNIFFFLFVLLWLRFLWKKLQRVFLFLWAHRDGGEKKSIINIIMECIYTHNSTRVSERERQWIKFVNFFYCSFAYAWTFVLSKEHREQQKQRMRWKLVLLNFNNLSFINVLLLLLLALSPCSFLWLFFLFLYVYYIYVYFQIIYFSCKKVFFPLLQTYSEIFIALNKSLVGSEKEKRKRMRWKGLFLIRSLKSIELCFKKKISNFCVSHYLFAKGDN